MFRNKTLATTLCIDTVIFVCTLLFAKHSLVLLGIYVIASILVLLSRKADIKLYVIAIILALIIEPLLVRFGDLSYPISNVAGVPFWIFLMWGLGAVSMYRLGTYLGSRHRS